MAFAKVQEACPDARLVLVSSLCDYDYYKRLNKLINDLGLESSVYFQVGAIEIWPIFRSSPVFLRITSTDGDSVSIKEALSFHCKVIATNVVSRPEGVLVVDVDNIDQLASEILKVLSK